MPSDLTPFFVAQMRDDLACFNKLSRVLSMQRETSPTRGKTGRGHELTHHIHMLELPPKWPNQIARTEHPCSATPSRGPAFLG